MDENTQPEMIPWEYKWSSGDLNELNRLGREGWEAVGTNSSTNTLVFGATVSPSVSVLFKKRFYPKPPKDNEAGSRLKQLLEEERTNNCLQIN